MTYQGPRAATDGATPEQDHAAERAEASEFAKAQKVYQLVSEIVAPTTIGLLLAIALLVTIGWLGGWDAVSDDGEALPVADPGETITADPFTFVIGSARYGDELPPIARAAEATRYLFVSAEVTNTSNRPLSATFYLAAAVRVELPGLQSQWGDNPTRPEIFRGLDALSQGEMQPGLTYSLVFMWVQDASAPPPSELTVTLSKYTFRQSVLDGAQRWMDIEDASEVLVPVKPIGATP